MSEELNLPDMVEEEDNSPISVLNPTHTRFVHMYVTGQYTNHQLAEMFDVHPNTILRWLKRQDVQVAIAHVNEVTHETVSNKLKIATTQAMDKLIQLMQSPIDGVALQAVKDVLDRAGHKPKQEIKVDKTVITYEQKLSDLIEDTIDITDYVEVE